MKITGIKAYRVSLPMRSTAFVGSVSDSSGTLYRRLAETDAAALAAAQGRFHRVESCIAEIHTDTGLVGYGEAESACALYDVFTLGCENLIGADPMDIQRNMRDVLPGKNVGKRLPLVREHMSLESAMWDLTGKSAGLPVYNLLGGRVREKQAVSVIIGQKPIDECLKDVAEALNAGIRTMKINAGANDQRDVDLLRAIRAQFGYEFILRVNAGGAWGNVTEAVRVMREMEPYNLQYVENALSLADAESYRRVRDMTGMPLCMSAAYDQNAVTAYEALAKTAEIVRSDAADVISVDPSNAGGILGFTQIAAFCEGAGVEVIADRSYSGLSQAMLLHAAAVCNSCDYAQTIVPDQYAGGCADNVLKTPPEQKNGFMVAPSGAGFGVEINRELLEKYTVATVQVGSVE